MENLHFVEAVTPEQLLLMSQLHAMGWRTAYRGMIPSEYLDHHIREDGWVDRFQRRYAAGEAHGLLLYRGEKPVCCISYGDVRTDPEVLGGVLELGPDSLDCAGWGEIHSFYAHPEETGRGYGSLVVEEVLRRFREEGRPGAGECGGVPVLRKARLLLGRSPAAHLLPPGRGVRGFTVRAGFAS